MAGAELSRYKIIDELGRGGMSTVFSALDTELHRTVALKVLHSHLAPRPEVIERFKREARAVARLHHDNILEIYDFSAEGPEKTFIVTEMIEGKDLAAFLSEHRLKIPELGALIVAETALGLAHAHQNGVVHRDIKPQNVMLRNDGTVKLMDFGIARILDEGQMTVTGTVLGSPAHMCPELIQGRQVDSRGDIFSLGILLYQCTTGELPFKGNNPSTLFKRILELDYLPPEAVNPAIGRKLSGIISRCLCLEPDDRIQTALQLRGQLLEITSEVGLDNPKEEIRLLLEDPAAREAVLLPRVTQRLKRAARENYKKGSLPAALDYLERALVLMPEDEESKKLLERVSRKRRWRKAASYVLGVAMLAILAVAAVLAYRELLIGAQPTPASVDEAQNRKGGRNLTKSVRAGSSQAESSELAARDKTASHTGEPARRKEPARGDSVKQPITLKMRGKKSKNSSLRRMSRKVSAVVPAGDKVALPLDNKIRTTADIKAKRIVLAQYWADVFVDGRKVGRVPPPLPLDLGAGVHEVELLNTFCDPFSLKVNITNSGTERLPVHLHCPARLDIAAPAGALVFVDQELKGSTPLKGPLELDWSEPAIEKKVTLRVTKRNHVPFEKSLALKRGTTVKIDVDLVPEKK